MRMTRTKKGFIAVERKTHNGAYERLCILPIDISLKEAKARYSRDLDKIEAACKGRALGRELMKASIAIMIGGSR